MDNPNPNTKYMLQIIPQTGEEDGFACVVYIHHKTMGWTRMTRTSKHLTSENALHAGKSIVEHSVNKRKHRNEVIKTVYLDVDAKVIE